MPFYRFLVHGVDERVPEEMRGFFTTRHAHATDQEAARAKVVARLEQEFTSGASAHIWRSCTPRLSIEKAWRIGLIEALKGPNKGSTFYDDRE
jgi:hypothetical protein